MIWSHFFSSVFKFFSIKIISFGSNINYVFEYNNDQLNTDYKIAWAIEFHYKPMGTVELSF